MTMTMTMAAITGIITMKIAREAMRQDRSSKAEPGVK
jgi:hypothetical protein